MKTDQHQPSAEPLFAISMDPSPCQGKSKGGKLLKCCGRCKGKQHLIWPGTDLLSLLPEVKAAS